MLKISISCMMLCICMATHAQIKLPALSPSIEISQDIGLTTATVSYARPSLRGRSLFGDNGILVVGEKWRTGANATTKVVFSDAIVIQGNTLPKGAYALLTTPKENTWTFHWYAYENLPYTQFVAKEPVLEVTVPIQQVKDSVETFSLHFEAINLYDATLVLQWANYKAALAISANAHEKVLATIDKELEGPSNFDYFQAALYLHETQTELPRALGYIQKVTQSDSALFFQVYREALILKDLDRKKEAVEAAKRAKLLSEKAGNKDLARLSLKLINELSR